MDQLSWLLVCKPLAGQAEPWAESSKPGIGAAPFQQGHIVGKVSWMVALNMRQTRGPITF